jgi:hypothetical protein
MAETDLAATAGRSEYEYVLEDMFYYSFIYLLVQHSKNLKQAIHLSKDTYPYSK